MAEKKKAVKSSSTVTRIKAVDDTSVTKSETKPKKTKTLTTEPTKGTEPKKRKTPSAKGIFRPFVLIGGYFKGAWQELKQVRWPTRRATWNLTGAVILYSVFFAVLVLLLDALFKYLFELILGK